MSRFGYGVLLPSMRAELGWSYAQASLLESANAAGYLVGALLSPVAIRVFGAATALRRCGLLAALSLLACAATDLLPWLLVARGVGGAATAAVFVSGSLLAARMGAAVGRSGSVLAVYYSGVGPGILITAPCGRRSRSPPPHPAGSGGGSCCVRRGRCRCCSLS